MPKKKTKQQFITECKQIHGDKYKFDKFQYINGDTKAIIICPEHGDFLQLPRSLLRGHGCKKCAGNNKKTTEEFILDAKKVHGDKYDYSKFKYEHSRKTKSIIICSNHGEFLQNANQHLQGKACIKCGRERRAKNATKTTEEFIKQANEKHNNKYDYSKFKYVHNKKQAIIICPDHGEFLQEPRNHLYENGCPSCAHNKKSTTEEFIIKSKKVHGDKYNYSLVEYVSCMEKVKIICPDHGEFLMEPRCHSSLSQGCSLCFNKTEAKLKKWLEELYPNDVLYQFAPKWCKNKKTNRYLRFDFLIKSKKLIIEVDGKQHFEVVEYFNNNVEKRVKRDKYKMEKANKNGYSVIRIIQDDVWLNKNNWEEKLKDEIRDYRIPQNRFICENREYKNHN